MTSPVVTDGMLNMARGAVDDQSVAETKSDNPDDKILYVWRSPFDNDVVHIVNANTIRFASAADDAPVLVDFGDLRRHGDLSELSERLDQCGVTLDEYIAGIEASDGRKPEIGDPATRLASLNDLDFDGIEAGDYDPDDEDRFLPADDVEFLTEWEKEDEPAAEYRGYVIIARAMSSDIPSDLFTEFCAESWGDTPAYSGHIDDHVAADKLPALVAALEMRGYTVIEE